GKGAVVRASVFGPQARRREFCPRLNKPIQCRQSCVSRTVEREPDQPPCPLKQALQQRTARQKIRQHRNKKAHPANSTGRPVFKVVATYLLTISTSLWASSIVPS